MMLQVIYTALRQSFQRPIFFVIALFVAMLVLGISIVSPNVSFWKDIVFSEVFSFGEKARILSTFHMALITAFTPLGRFVIINLAFLSGINAAMLFFAVREKILVGRNHAVVGGSGLIVGLLGAGCAACGAFLLGSLLSLFGAGAVLAFLPLRGVEFGICGILLLLVSIYLLSRAIATARSCPIE